MEPPTVVSSRTSRALAIVGVLLLKPMLPGAQVPTDIAGSWTVNGSQWGQRVAAPGGFPVTLLFRVGDSEVTMQRNRGPLEVYTLDGSETTLPDGRTATAEVEDGALLLMLTRTRTTPAGPYTITLRELYRASGRTLTLERRYRGGPAGDIGRSSPAQRVTYSRDP